MGTFKSRKMENREAAGKLFKPTASPGAITMICSCRNRSNEIGRLIAMKLSRLETFVKCGFKRDPFKAVNLKTIDKCRAEHHPEKAVDGGACHG